MKHATTRRMWVWIVGFGMMLSSVVHAQEVTTFLEDTIAHGNIVLGPDGNLYVSDYTGTNSFNGQTVAQINLDGTATTFTETLAGPTGIAFADNGSVYIANYNRGDITRVTPTGVRFRFAQGLNGPSGIVFDDDGNLVVVNGGFPFPGNHPISKIDPSGTITTFSTSSLFNGLDGITKDDQGNFYVTNYNDGRIIKVTADGTASLFAELPRIGPGSAGWITFANGRLYVTASLSNQVYELALDGTLTLLAGTGQVGNTDGNALEATFQFPNGIAASVTGDTLFVTETPPAPMVRPKRIRMIIGIQPEPVNTEQATLPEQITLEQNYPNPFNPSTTIAYRLDTSERVVVGVYDRMGRLVQQLVDKHQAPGAYTITFDATGLASGLYYYRLQAGTHRKTKAMSLVK